MTAQVELLAPAAATDAALVEALRGVINRAYAIGEAGLWVEGAERITAAQVAEAIAAGMVVARVGGEIAGCACVRRLDPATADLGLISVDPGRQGAGVGRALVREAEDVMRSRGVTTAQLEVLVPREGVHPAKEQLRAWYERLGYRTVRVAAFEEVATHLASDLATACEFLIMRKRLAGPQPAGR